jgi:hypothetical protein
VAIKDLHNNILVKRSISPVAIGTTGTGQVGKPVDTLGFNAVEVIVNYGSVTATNAVFTASILEGDVTGTLTAVAAGNLIGNLPSLAAQATARTSGVGKNFTKRCGYAGTKRYISVNVSSTVTAGTLISADVIGAVAENKPVAT